MKRLALAIAFVNGSLLPVATLADEMDDRIDRLEQEIQQLKNQQASTQPAQGSAAASASGASISLGGYVKFDGQVSDYSDGSGATASIGEDFLVPSTIPTDGGSGDMNTHFNAKESRLWLKAQTPTSVGAITGYLEMDFEGSSQGDERITNSYSPRLRHAYVSWENWLFGQTWSTFFNVSALPDLLDFVGPVGTIFVRQAQVRYTLGGLQFALENPSSTLYDGTENPYDNNQIPDMIARYNFGDERANLSASLMVRELAYEDTVANISRSDSEYGYALSIAGRVAVGDGGDDLRFMVNQGNALGRYMGLNAFRAGAISPINGDIDLADQWGAFAAYRHLWDEQWRSSFSLSAAGSDNPSSAGGTAPEAYQTMHANLIYSPTRELEMGGELIYGNKELDNGQDGDVTRLQFSAKYTF